MADWRDKAGLPAVFRGAAFFVAEGERSGGRQSVVHDFPFDETPPYVEDLGKRGRAFTVEGFVLGTEYEAQRDSLLTALETAGPGELVHPHFGTRRVAVDKFRVRERGGVAQFTIDFLETGDASKPTTSLDTRANLLSVITKARGVVSAVFAAAHSRVPFSGVYAPPLGETDLIASVGSTIASVLNQNPIAPLARAAFAQVARGTFGQAAQPPALATVAEVTAWVVLTQIDAAVTALQATSGPLDPSALALSFYDSDPGARPNGTSAAVAALQADYDATRTLVQRVALLAAATLVLEQSFGSYDDAVAARAKITDLIDTHVAGLADDSFAALSDLAAALVLAVPGESSDLPHLQEYTPPATVPSLVLAHRLYGNLDREADLIRRNHVQYPGFITGGQALEVLSDG